MSHERARKKRRLAPPESGPYVLRKVLDDIPLASDEGSEPVSITCVEFWNNNLYIGTSASEILHLVGLPGESDADPLQYILATRLQPSGHDAASATAAPGVQQILVLPGPNKAVVLCNGTASFYSLPELSPEFTNREPTGVQWIGGYDENEGRDDPEGTNIMIAMQRSILRVQVGAKLKPIKPNIQYPDCRGASRRDTIACVADGRSYALIEIEHQQKIPLFEISSAPEPDAPRSGLLSPGSAHMRSKSLGDFSPSSERTHSPDKDKFHMPSPGQQAREDSRSPNRRRASTTETGPTAAPPRQSSAQSLKPHVLSPFANEFMLTTGTSPSEPGVGMFVNVDGDVSRGTIEFDQYPHAVLAYDFSQDLHVPDHASDQHIIALLDKSQTDHSLRGLQIQSLAEDGTVAPTKCWLEFPLNGRPPQDGRTGLHKCLSVQQHKFSEVADLLQAVRYRLGRRSPLAPETDPRTKSSIERFEQENALFENQSTGSSSPTPDYDAKRSAEELAFVQRFGGASTQALAWSNDNLWQLLPNPLLLRLENELLRSVNIVNEQLDYANVHVPPLLSFLGSIREREPRDETEFLSIKYARQKGSVMLFLHLLAGIKDNQNLRAACQIVESALHEGEVDPRIVLSPLRPLSREVIQGATGIWIHQGIADCFSDFESPVLAFEDAPAEFWSMMRHFLSTWQKKRGFGSITDEKAVFDTVDAALLHLLLHLESARGRTGAEQAPTRIKLLNIVDDWKGDFDRAVTLLEHYHRLYVLSRLYQSRRSAKDVLHTWKRVCEGEENADQNFTAQDALQRMREYLPRIRDASLVQEYAILLAQQAPDLAVQVLSDDDSRVKFSPAEVVSMLKSHAPGSVQLFLEHLVFAKNLDQYVDDLVGYYLDSVLNVLEASEQARQSLAESYTTYRALTSPKPTYLNFIQGNAPDEPWWQSRLRLLQLLGAGGYANASGSSKALTYSIEMVLDRLKPFSTYLVSESIILDARQGRHNEALQLLVHGLGDYDTAVRYCYFGGPSSPSGTIDAGVLPPRDQQEAQFRFLFNEFLLIEDVEERLDRTSHLLGTFATWFDPLTVLSSIPDSWSVSLLSDFLLRTFRAAVTKRNQAIIIKALSAAQNLQKQVEFVATCEKIGAKLEVDSSAPSAGLDEAVRG